MLRKIAFACLLVAVAGVAQTTTDIHLFQNYSADAVITDVAYDEVFADFRTFSYGAATNFGLKGGFALAPQFEINGELSLATMNRTDMDSQFGLSDMIISGRYIAYKKGATAAALGARLTLPFGDSDVGYGNGGFAMFGALRQTLNDASIFTATAGLRTIPDNWGDQESTATFTLGGGLIRRLNVQNYLVIEGVVYSKIDYLLFSAGVDRIISGGAHLRGMLGVGAAANAPDIWVSLGYVFSF